MEVEKIIDFWLDSSFLERFKKIGEYYEKEIKKELEQIGGTNGK